MAALTLPEYYADLAQTTLSSSYTAGAGVIVVTTAANLSTTRQFHFMITDQTTGAVKVIGKATALTSSTFTITATTDANAASGDFVTITLCAAAMDQIISDCDQQGTYASLPTSIPPAGRRYKCTDSPYEFISTGSVWQAYVYGMPATVPPAAGSWTSVNLGVALSSTHGPVYLVASTSGNDFLSMAYVAAPGSTPYSFIARCNVDSSGFMASVANGGSTGGANNGGFAFGWRDSGGKFVVLMMDQTITGPTWNLLVTRWSSNTSVSSSPLSVANPGWAAQFGPSGIFYKIQNDGTNLNFFISLDGQTFYNVYHETITAFLAAATDVTFGCYGHTNGSIVQLLDWTQGV